MINSQDYKEFLGQPFWVMPQEIRRKFIKLIIAVFAIIIIELIFRLFGGSLLTTLSYVINFFILKLTGLFVLIQGNSLHVDREFNLLMLNDQQTFSYIPGMFGFRYYLIGFFSIFLYERNKKRFGLYSIILAIIFLIISSILLCLRLNGNQNLFTVEHYMIANESLLTCVLIFYFAWKAILVYKNRYGEDYWKYFFNTTATTWFVFIGLWWLLYLKFTYNQEFKADMYYAFSHYLIKVSSFILGLFGYESNVINRTLYGVITATGKPFYLFMGKACVGFQIMHVFAFIVILYYGKVIPKLIYILFGLFVINFLNVIRVIFLFTYMARTGKKWSGFFNAHDMYNVPVYISIILLWLLYMYWFHPRVTRWIEKK